LLFRGGARRECRRARIARLQDPRRGPLPLGPSKRGYLTKRGGAPRVLARIGDEAAAFLEESLILAADADSDAERGRPGATARKAERLMFRFEPMVSGGVSVLCRDELRRVFM
jgi:hypothetical protein